MFERFVWQGKGTDQANCDQVEYQCENQDCKRLIPEYHRRSMVAAGRWKATAESYGHAGFHLNRFYSPWESWSDLARNYEANRHSPETEQVFWNTVLGLPYPRKGQRLKWELLLDRARTLGSYELQEIAAGGRSPLASGRRSSGQMKRLIVRCMLRERQ